MANLVKSALGAVLSPLMCPHSFWAVKLRRNRHAFLTELDMVRDKVSQQERPFDWSKDLIDNGDYRLIEEIWLFCPPHKNTLANNPLGTTARLQIKERGTAFQFKVANMFGILETERVTMSQVIGRVDDKFTGACTCFIWDSDLQVMSQPWHTNIYKFGSWRDAVAPIGQVSHHVLGLDLS